MRTDVFPTSYRGQCGATNPTSVSTGDGFTVVITGGIGPQGPKGEKGDTYALTDDDRQEIAEQILDGLCFTVVNGALQQNFYTEEVEQDG